MPRTVTQNPRRFARTTPQPTRRFARPASAPAARSSRLSSSSAGRFGRSTPAPASRFGRAARTKPQQSGIAKALPDALTALVAKRAATGGGRKRSKLGVLAGLGAAAFAGRKALASRKQDEPAQTFPSSGTSHAPTTGTNATSGTYPA